MSTWRPDPPSRSIGSGVSSSYIAALIGRAALDQILDGLAQAYRRPDSRDVIDYITAWKVLNINVETMADEGHRISSTVIPNGNFELLIASMFQGNDLSDGLARMGMGARILRPDLIFQVGARLGHVKLTVEFARGETLAQAIYLEALITVIHCALRWGLERDIDPIRVRGPAIINPNHGSWLNLFGVPVQRHGEGVTIVYGADVATSPFRQRAFKRWHDATFNEYLRLVGRLETQSTTVAPVVTGRVRDALMRGVNGQAEIAKALAMSVPSLRRRLTEEGSSFRNIQSSLRREAAHVMLLGEKSVEEIATELGLSDSRCFRRACQAWFGGSPSAVRRAFRKSAVAVQQTKH
jgi:AraC-like DNA-binding protein